MFAALFSLMCWGAVNRTQNTFGNTSPSNPSWGSAKKDKVYINQHLLVVKDGEALLQQLKLKGLSMVNSSNASSVLIRGIIFDASGKLVASTQILRKRATDRKPWPVLELRFANPQPRLRSGLYWLGAQFSANVYLWWDDAGPGTACLHAKDQFVGGPQGRFDFSGAQLREWGHTKRQLIIAAVFIVAPPLAHVVSDENVGTAATLVPVVKSLQDDRAGHASSTPGDVIGAMVTGDQRAALILLGAGLGLCLACLCVLPVLWQWRRLPGTKALQADPKADPRPSRPVRALSLDSLDAAGLKQHRTRGSFDRLLADQGTSLSTPPPSPATRSSTLQSAVSGLQHRSRDSFEHLSEAAEQWEAAGGGHSELSGMDVVAYAVHLGMDPVQDADLLWIAEEALTSPEPEGWVEVVGSSGQSFFVNELTLQTSTEHPLELHYRALYQVARHAAVHHASVRTGPSTAPPASAQPTTNKASAQLRRSAAKRTKHPSQDSSPEACPVDVLPHCHQKACSSDPPHSQSAKGKTKGQTKGQCGASRGRRAPACPRTMQPAATDGGLANGREAHDQTSCPPACPPPRGADDALPPGASGGLLEEGNDDFHNHQWSGTVLNHLKRFGRSNSYDAVPTQNHDSASEDHDLDIDEPSKH